MKKTVAVGISGGVDSAAAAYLLQSKGYDVFGITMLVSDEYAEMEDAEYICRHLGIKHHVIDLRNSFRIKVTEPFSDIYFSGKTPNPCIMCNHHIKYGELMEKSLDLGADFFATGHYARIVYEDNIYKLKKALYPRKNQTYLLHMLNQKKLRRILLPLGEFSSKDEVKKIASNLNMRISEKKESNNLCFTGDRSYGDYLKRNFPDKDCSGYYKLISGEIIGSHPGYYYHTPGQKRKLFVNTDKTVIRIAAEDNTVLLGDESQLFSHTIHLKNVSFTREISTDRLIVGFQIFQWGHTLKGELVKQNQSGFIIKPDNPVRAVAPGQYAVFYLEDEVIGGGEIII